MALTESDPNKLVCQSDSLLDRWVITKVNPIVQNKWFLFQKKDSGFCIIFDFTKVLKTHSLLHSKIIKCNSCCTATRLIHISVSTACIFPHSHHPRTQAKKMLSSSSQLSFRIQTEDSREWWLYYKSLCLYWKVFLLKVWTRAWMTTNFQ